MTRLFAELYIDEDVSVLVANLLRVRRFQAQTAREAGNLGRTDSEQLAYAAARGMAIVTHNRLDFETLHRQYLSEGRSHWGVIIASRRRPYLIVDGLLRLLDRLTADELHSQLLYV